MRDFRIDPALELTYVAESQQYCGAEVNIRAVRLSTGDEEKGRRRGEVLFLGGEPLHYSVLLLTAG